jgi:glycosyltransferase involved in cell wall biosynthesis
MREPRVAFVTNVLAHYRVPCFHALAARMPGRISYFVLTDEMAQRDYVLAKERGVLPLHVLPGKAFTRPPYDNVHLNDVRPALRGYDLIILSGWAEPSYLLLWSLAQMTRKRIAFWLESTQDDFARAGFKELLKKKILAQACGVVASGTRAAEYCQALGFPRPKIYCAPNAVNVDYFRQQAAQLAPQRAALRQELGLNGVTLLFVGRMIESMKSVSTLLRAQQILENKNLPAELVLIGEGQDRTAYEHLARELNLQRVRFENFMPHDALCCYYASADVMVLPSRSEPWGFVLNEAMEFGLPLVASDAVGAAPDLIGEGVNGFSVPRENAAALATALEKLVMNALVREQMGAASRARIASFTPDAWADGFARAIEAMTA